MHHFIVKTEEGTKVLKEAEDCIPAVMIKELEKIYGTGKVSWEFVPVEMPN